MKKLLLILALAACAGSNQIVIAIAGQSNAMGWGKCVSDGAASFPTAIDSLRQLWWGNDSLVIPIFEPSSGNFAVNNPFEKPPDINTKVCGSSMATTLANSIVLNAGDTVRIVHCDRSGSGLIDKIPEKDWTLRGAGTLFHQLIVHTKAAGTASYLVWWQGENEIIASAAYCSNTDYLAALRALIKDTRDSLGITSLPWIFVMPGRCVNGANSQAFFVRSAINTIAANDANCYLATVAFDRNDVGDRIHINTAGQNVIGQRVARCINYLRGKNSYYSGVFNISQNTISADKKCITSKISFTKGTAIIWQNSVITSAVGYYLGDNRIYPKSVTASGDSIVGTFEAPIYYSGNLKIALYGTADFDSSTVGHVNDSLSLPTPFTFTTITGQN